MTNSRIFLWTLAAFLGGVAIRSFVPVPIVFVWTGGIAGVMLSSSGFLRSRRTLAASGLFLLALALGFWRFDYVERSAPDLSVFYGREVALRGVMRDEPRLGSQSQRVTIKVFFVNESRVSQEFFALVTTRRYPRYNLGDELVARGALERPENFGAFDYVAYLARDDIFSVMAFPEVEKIGEGKGSRVSLWLSRIKHSFEYRIDAALPDPHAAFLKGLLLGEREALPPGLLENFQKTGTSHIVALSGYNITVVGRSLMQGLLALTAPFYASSWIASGAIIFFVFLTGASASVVRAGIMGLLLLLAERSGRLYRMTNALIFAAALMVFHNPKILRFDVAFQLSFLATVGLIYVSPRLEKFFYRLGRRIKILLGLPHRPLGSEEHAAFLSSLGVSKIKTILVETLSAQIAVLPLLVYLFGRVSLVSPLTNVLILMAVPPTMAAGFLAGLAGYLWFPFARIVAWPVWLLMTYQIRVIEFFAGFRFASFEVFF